MKPNSKFLALLLAVMIFVLTGYLVRHNASALASSTEGRKVIFYQDSMHPWVKSDQPGKCTICNMDLTPIYEGEKGFGMSDNIVALSSNSVTVINVQTEEIKHQPLFRTLRVAGTLEANETHKTIIATPVACQIQTLAVEYAGVEVEKGQTLATLFSPELVQRRAYLNVLGLTFASPSNFLSQSKTTDPYLSDLVAPQSGTVLERNVYVGQYVEEGDKLFTIADPSVLWFRFDVYEQQLPWFEPGQTIEVTVRAVPGRKFPAIISFIEPTLSEATRAVKVRADVANPIVSTNGRPHRLLQFGMYAEGRVRSGLSDVLAVPRTAILFPGSSAYAYVDKEDGAYERRRVQLGRQGDDHWEVLQGLEEGDRVVTSGNVLIDAQAQFNQGSKPDVIEMTATNQLGDQVDPERSTYLSTVVNASTMTPQNNELNPAWQQTLMEFLAVADGIGQALASNDVELLKQRAGLLSNAVASLTHQFEGEISSRSTLERFTPDAPLSEPAALTVVPAAITSTTNLAGQENVKSASEMARARLDLRYARIAQRDEGRQMRIAAIAEARSKEATAANTLTEKQRETLAALIAEAASISQVLAADDLEQFNSHFANLPALLSSLPTHLSGSHRWNESIQNLAAMGPWPPAKDLAEARGQFLPFSTATVELARTLRKEDPAFAGLKIYHCPMAPKPGLWMQAKGPLRNPFYGSKMLTCGKEIVE